MRRRLFRCVPLLDFQKGDPPTFLYTSGRPNRWNPRGVNCLYFSETERTANDEYDSFWRGTPGEGQPKMIFRAEVSFRKVVDLANPESERALRVGKRDHEENWRLATTPTRPQELGRALSLQRSIVAVRYPSLASRRRGRRGWNVAIFPSAIGAPDRLAILGEGADPLEVLPEPV